jgi:AcrR family transcriptional regulator
MACHRVMQRVGPSRFTLALVAKEAGLAPATIVQRFGSKRQLIRALATGAKGQGAATLAELRTRHQSPLDLLREYLLCWAQMARTPKEMANHLAYLQMDLTDPVLLANLVELTEENLEITAQLLREADDAGLLRVRDAYALARALNAAITGGLLAWATFRRGTAREWLERDLEVLLAPLKTP